MVHINSATLPNGQEEPDAESVFDDGVEDSVESDGPKEANEQKGNASDQGASDQEASDQGAVAQGSQDEGTTEQGTPGQGTAEQGAATQSTTGSGAPGQGATEQDTSVLPSHSSEIFLLRRRHRMLEDGAELTCVVTVHCFSTCDLTGETVLIRSNDDPSNEFLVTLTTFNRIENETHEFVLKTGVDPGTYSWTATFSNAGFYGKNHSEVSSTLSFNYTPHALSLAIWNVPTFLEGGESMVIRVGARCSHACSLAGRKVMILDKQGTVLAENVLGDELWPGSEALYSTELSLKAPLEEGIHNFSACIEGWAGEGVEGDGAADAGAEKAAEAGGAEAAGAEAAGAGAEEAAGAEAAEAGAPGHSSATSSFVVSVVKPPENHMRITVIDKATQKPLEGAWATIHPYRLPSDEKGQVELPMKKGKISLMVKAEDYYTYKSEVITTGDAELLVELELKPHYAEDF